MDLLDKTIFATSEDDLQKIYEEELKTLKEKEFIMECVMKLEIEDFPVDLSNESKKNIEEALRIFKIHRKIDIGNNLTLFGLKDLSGVKLSSTEQKLIRDCVQNMIDKEKDKRINNKLLEEKIQNSYEKFLELNKQIEENAKNLESFKLEELELCKQVAQVLVSDDQKLVVKEIEEELEALELRIKAGIESLENHEMSKTKFAKEAFEQLSNRVEELTKKELEK